MPSNVPYKASLGWNLYLSVKSRVTKDACAMEGGQQQCLQGGNLCSCEARRRFPLPGSFHQVSVILQALALDTQNGSITGKPKGHQVMKHPFVQVMQSSYEIKLFQRKLKIVRSKNTTVMTN